MATLAIPTHLPSIDEQGGSSPLAASEETESDFERALRAKIQEGLMHLVEEAKAEKESKLEERGHDESEKSVIIQNYNSSMTSIRRIAHEQFIQIMAHVREASNWVEGRPAPATLLEEQEAILEALRREQGGQLQLPRARSSSDASSIAGSQRGESSTRYPRLDEGERLPDRSRNSYGRPPVTPNGSLRGGQPMSGISAMLSDSMHGVPTDVDLPEPARNGLSRRASKASLLSEQEIWLPPTTPEGAGPTSRALAYAVADSPVPPPSARRDSFASSTGRVSRSGSIQSGYVQVDSEVPSSAYIPRGRNVPEEPAPQSARAREKQREAQPQLVRPRLPSDIANRRNDDRPPAPSPAWSQFTTDSHYPFAQTGSGMEYPPPTERKGIPIKSQGTSRASSGRRGSPESLRQARTANKNSWGYDSSPGSAGLFGPQSLQSGLATGASRPLAHKPSFTGDDDARLPQTSPVTRMWHGSKGRRDSTGSHSVRSQRSRSDLLTRADGQMLPPVLSDGSASDSDDWGAAGYGVGNLERLHRRDETLRELNAREEDFRRKIEASERQAADAERKMADAEKRDSEARRRDEEARQRDKEARDMMEDARKLETSARKLEEAVRQREGEVRGKEDEVRKREVKIRAREDEVLRKEDEMRTKFREAQKRWDEVARREQAVRRKEEQVAARDDALKAREDALSAQETTLQGREEDAEQREIALSVVETDLSQREADIARQESGLQHRDDELKTKEFMLCTLEEQLQAREAILHEQGQQEQALLDESRRVQAQKQREEDERRQRAEEAQRAKEEMRQRAEEAQRAERVQAEQRARREEQEAQEARQLTEDRRKKEEERKRREEERRRQALQREEIKRQEEQVLEENRRREAAERQAVEADARRVAEATRRASAEQPNGNQHDAPSPVDEDLVFDAENVSPELIRQQEALLKQYARNRNDSMSSDGSPRSTAFVSASQSAPRNIPGRASSSAGAPAADRSSTASSSSYQSSSGFSFSSGHSGTSTYTQASTYSQASTVTPSSTPTPSVKQTRGGWKPAGAPPTSATTAQSQFAAASSLPPPTPQEEEEWKRRQREHARQQAEKFQRMQEQAEQERYSRSSKQLSREELVKLFEEHEHRWARLPNLDVLAWHAFPWPVLQPAKDPEDLTVQAIRAYVLSPHHPNERKKSAKDVIKDYIKRWHPDRFETRYLPKVREDDREKVKEGAGVVARNLNELLTRQSSLPDFAT
ncbi:hypothetical protein FOMPIDRAFT_98117 [Fomitopsis schrenkii]|uniref:Uncharacterized protein n=1 Tax=Fomitopsis schrenkii TaxID=2126942 RepID=S8EX02_FOMSC|nr:hypothetical protein FOMPIDRAFT_98117 [Fomitopsis schrenkii]